MEPGLVRRKAVASCLSCSICRGTLNEATTVSVCLHSFCKSCITKKIVEEYVSNCPQCNTYLGGDPLEKLRVDNSLQKIRATIFPSNSYKPKFCHKSKLTCQSAPIANASPKSNTKKGELSNALMHFVESATVKLLNQLTSHSQQLQEIEQNHHNLSDVLVTGEGHDCQTYSRGPSPIWFSLISSCVKNGSSPLPQVTLCYLNRKNGNAPVQLIKKYLARKLNLSSEAEIEITLIGEVLGNHCCLKDMSQLWLRTLPQAKRIGEDSTKDAVMPLVYSRKT